MLASTGGLNTFHRTTTKEMYLPTAEGWSSALLLTGKLWCGWLLYITEAIEYRSEDISAEPSNNPAIDSTMFTVSGAMGPFIYCNWKQIFTKTARDSYVNKGFIQGLVSKTSNSGITGFF